MFSFEQTEEFGAWIRKIRDPIAKAAIAARLNMARHGNLGHCKAVGNGVQEMKINTGPGYRIYFARSGNVVYILLLGGDKSSQQSDIRHAINLWETIRKECNDQDKHI